MVNAHGPSQDRKDPGHGTGVEVLRAARHCHVLNRERVHRAFSGAGSSKACGTIGPKFQFPAWPQGSLSQQRPVVGIWRPHPWVAGKGCWGVPGAGGLCGWGVWTRPSRLFGLGFPRKGMTACIMHGGAPRQPWRRTTGRCTRGGCLNPTRVSEAPRFLLSAGLLLSATGALGGCSCAQGWQAKTLHGGDWLAILWRPLRSQRHRHSGSFGGNLGELAAGAALFDVCSPFRLAVCLHERAAHAEYWVFAWMPLILNEVGEVRARLDHILAIRTVGFAGLFLPRLPTV